VIEAAIQQPDKALVFLRPGRLVRVREGAVDWGWGIVCSVSRRPGNNGAADGAAAPAAHYMLDTLLATAAGSMKGALCGASRCWFTGADALCAEVSPRNRHHMSEAYPIISQLAVATMIQQLSTTLHSVPNCCATRLGQVTTLRCMQADQLGCCKCSREAAAG